VTRARRLVLAVLPLLASCISTRPPWLGEHYVLLQGGPIYVDASQPPVEALLIEDGRVKRAGTVAEVVPVLDELEQRSKDWDMPANVERIDLAGACAVPGLQDAHGHIEGLGEALENVDLTGVPSVEELVRRVQARANELPPGTWITGRGWDQTLWSGQQFPTHEALSSAVPDHPVFLERVDGHAAFVNARALALAGLDGRSPLPDIPGGRIVTGPAGEPTGVLVDAATTAVTKFIPPPDGATRARRILAAQDALLAVGLVAVHDMGTAPETLPVLEELQRDGKLQLRILSYLWANDGLERFGRSAKPRGDVGDHWRVVGAKLMVDGALGSRGAALLEPYADAPDETGLLQLTPDAYAKLLRTALAAGLQPATHAIGDRGNRMVLDAYYAETQRSGRIGYLRPRVEHAQVVAPEDWPRFEAMGAIPSMQPTHATSDMRWAEARLGPERVAGAYAWKRLRGEHAPLALGSDFPVEKPDPLLGLYAARTRQDAAGNPAGGWLPDQTLSGAEALAGFTDGAAYAAREEGERGRLLPGFRADVTVLSVDPVRCEPRELLSAHVQRVIIDGTTVYEHAPEAASR